MRIPPTNPFHIARAYQTQAPKTARSLQAGAGPVAGSIKPAPSSRMVAGQVPGGVDFSGAEAKPAGPALPFYRHPADKNAAATAVTAGRNLDIQA